ncbi:hypothetical protein CFP56_014061 [Quercus suber]|uniref:Uncharacterized protein n=1 Tax=Quercus suber TaxID=58331 RepID=A0AAW0KT89_QUESU
MRGNSLVKEPEIQKIWDDNDNEGNSLTQAKWRLGDGTNIPIGHFVWPSFRAENRGIEAKQLTLVAGLMDKSSGRWNQQLVLSLYDNSWQTLFRCSLSQCLDSRIELSGLTLKSGSYEVTTGFRLLTNNQLIYDSASGHHDNHLEAMEGDMGIVAATEAQAPKSK